MRTLPVRSDGLEIREVTAQEEASVLGVYQQCEDFLGLGPEGKASLAMVRKDMQISHSQGGSFCGIYLADGQMIGVVDFVPSGYEGNPGQADLTLLMIAAPYRRQGIGAAVVAVIEGEIRRNPQVRVIVAGVQVNNPQAVRFWQRLGYQIVSGAVLMPDQTTVYRLRKELG